MSILINSRVSGNLGGGVHILTNNVASLYNTIVAGNIGTQADAASTLNNSYAPGHAGSLLSENPVNQGDNDHYPVDADGNLVITSPAYGAVNSLPSLPVDLKQEVIEYLRNDINGKSRFNGGAIDIGPEEQQ
jgi:hypothetical protein